MCYNTSGNTYPITGQFVPQWQHLNAEKSHKIFGISDKTSENCFITEQTTLLGQMVSLPMDRLGKFMGGLELRDR